MVNKLLRIQHFETHRSVNWLHDVILGGQDGLVNVLGIVLGVSAASSDNKILIAASMAAAFAEAVSMGAVAYTSTMADVDHYKNESEREKKEMEQIPDKEREEIREIYRNKGFEGDLLEKIVAKLTSDKEIWLKSMMTDELNLQPIASAKILQRSLIVGVAALIAAFIPVWPFFIFNHYSATVLSLLFSSVVLFLVGVYEAKTYVGVWWKNGLKMFVIGMGAALAGFVIGKIFHVN